MPELSGVYRYVGAGETVMRPMQIGPVMIFNNVKGHDDARVVIGLLASRTRVGLLLNTEPERLGFLLNEAVKSPIAPVIVAQEKALCQEIVHYADEPPTTPLGFNELSIAGAIRKQAVELTRCLTIREKAIANAEYVIEGELLPGIRVREDQNTNTGKAMPEFPGYTGPAYPELPVIKVKAVTHRRNPIMQTCIGPSEEHVNLAGIPTEASILQMVEKTIPSRLLNVYAHTSGGGK